MPYLLDFTTANSEQIGKALGERLEHIRLARNLSQERLANEAGVSVRTIHNLEKGNGSSFDTFIRVLTALGVQQNLETLLPDPTVRPIERVNRRGRERKRAAPGKGKQVAKAAWAWGDGRDDDD